MDASSVIGVRDLTLHIKRLLAADDILADVRVRGEMSNFKHHSSGHMYFTLKERDCCLRCVLFRSRGAGVGFGPADGMNVVAWGSVGIYERAGQYQLYVEGMMPDGLGTLHQAFERLKEKLGREGLFDQSRKRPIPFMPQSVGLVTSPTGAALRDMINVLGRRFPGVRIVLSPALVQGEAAPEDIRRALELLDAHGGCDVIIAGRGGGSLEELWAFNDERVARAVYACGAPVISAVGHETDVTICDLVADVRAPTPSAAAELAVPDKRDLARRVRESDSRLIQAGERCLERRAALLERYRFRLSPARLMDRLNQQRQRVDDLARGQARLVAQRLERRRGEAARLAERLHALSPLAVIGRGYSLCRTADGRLVRSRAQAPPGSTVCVLVEDGELVCDVRRHKEVVSWLKIR